MTKRPKELGGKVYQITEKDYDEGIARREIIEEMGNLGSFGCLIPLFHLLSLPEP